MTVLVATKGKERAPRRSGEGTPSRAFEAFERGRCEMRPVICCMQRRFGQRRNRDGPRQGRQASGVAGGAIRIAANGLGWIGGCVLAVRSFMLMVMVTDVLGCGTGFVSAIACYRRPAELQRHEHQQKNYQPFAHRANSVAAIGLNLPLLHPLGLSQSPVRVACLHTGSSGIKSGPLLYSTRCGRFDEPRRHEGAQAAQGTGGGSVNHRNTVPVAHAVLPVLRYASHRQPAGASSALRNS